MMEEHPNLLDLNLIAKEREWLVKREGDQQRSRGCSDEKKLELRLGLPGDEDNWSTKNNPKIQRDDSILSLNYFSSMTHRNGSSHHQDQKQAFASPWPCSGYQNQQQQQNQQQPAKVPFLQYQTGPATVAKDSSQPCCTRMVELQTAEKKAFSPASAAANTAVPNSSQKRAAPALVVGWPPVRSFRKNLASSSSSKPTLEPQNTIPSEIACGKPIENARKGLFVKINMDGVPIGRKVDLSAYDSYEKLCSAVNELFRGLLAAQRDSSGGGSQNKEEEEDKAITGLLDGSGEYTLVYEDNEGDRMLVGDVPWHMFVSTVKRLRVLKSSDLPTLNRGGQKQGKAPTGCASK
ncbi:hypothetical protein Ancab_012276 [Ancistrocladus abbreviatus]